MSLLWRCSSFVALILMQHMYSNYWEYDSVFTSVSLHALCFFFRWTIFCGGCHYPSCSDDYKWVVVVEVLYRLSQLSCARPDCKEGNQLRFSHAPAHHRWSLCDSLRRMTTWHWSISENIKLSTDVWISNYTYGHYKQNNPRTEIEILIYVLVLLQVVLLLW